MTYSTPTWTGEMAPITSEGTPPYIEIQDGHARILRRRYMGHSILTEYARNWRDLEAQATEMLHKQGVSLFLNGSAACPLSLAAAAVFAPHPTEEDWITTSEAVALVGISFSGINDAIRRGDLDYRVRLGQVDEEEWGRERRLVRKSQVEDLWLSDDTTTPSRVKLRQLQKEGTMSETELIRLRFDQKVDRSPGQGVKGECHLWTKGRTGGGYGAFWRHGKIVPAHRMAYILEHGPLAEGDYVLHDPEECDNKLCVRGEHLRVAHTSRTNVEGMKP